MSDIKLFRLVGNNTKEIQGNASPLEKPLQTLIECNLEPLLHIRFVSSEYSTGKTHAGRIDTLGLDENSCPVIIEYKRSSNENIINQGLFYLDWLMDHQADFTILATKKFGNRVSDQIDWTEPRLICIAADFTKYDSHAVQQMDRNIELLRYRQFGKELLLLEQVNAIATTKPSKKNKEIKNSRTDKTAAQRLATSNPGVQELLDQLERHLNTLGDDVQRKDLKHYIAFKRLRNFLTVCFQKNNLVLYLHVDPDAVKWTGENIRDVREIGHWGNGDLEITIGSQNDFLNAIPLIDRAYNGGDHE